MKKIIVIWLCSCLMASLLIVGIGNVEGAVTTGVTDELVAMGQYINATSDPVAIFGFGAKTDAADTLNIVVIRFSGAGWGTGDLLPLDTNSSVSGVGLYNDDSVAGPNNDVFDAGDTPVTTSGNSWMGDNCLMNVGVSVPLAATGIYEWFVVIRTNATLANNDKITARINTNDIVFSDGSTQPLLVHVVADTITADIVAPTVNVAPDETRNAMFFKDATTSDGAGSGIATWLWTQQTGAGTVSFGTPNAEDTNTQADADDIYTIRLTVDDNVGNSNFAEYQLTWDTIGPTATPTPANTTTGVATNIDYDLAFSEIMNTGLGSCLIEPTPPVAGAWGWEANMWYNYTGATWAEATTYWVNLTGFEDPATNPLTGDDKFWITTGESPTVTPTPADTTTGVATDVTYVLTFSEAMTAVGSCTVEPTPPVVGTWNWEANMWYNYTGATWAETTTYWVNLTGFQDADGWALTGDDQFWFTTADETNPTVTPNPANTTTGVATNVDYDLGFSEAMNTAVGSCIIEPAPPLAGTWNWEANMWYNYTGATWAEATTYWVNLTGFQDPSANPLTGDDKFWFTTGDTPTVTSTIPADGAINVNVTDNYTLEFSEPMNTGVFPSIDPTPPVGGNWAWDGTGMWCNYTYTGPDMPMLWAPATKYWVNLTGLGFQDVDGWALTGDIEFEFTIDEVPPVVSNLTCSPTTSVSFYNPCDITAQINETAFLWIVGVMFLTEAIGNATLDNYTAIAQFDEGSGVTLTPTGDANVTNLTFSWNATSPHIQSIFGWSIGGYISDGTNSDYLRVSYWENATGVGFIGVNVYYSNTTYDKVEAQLELYAENETINGLWIGDPINEWVNPSQFNDTMTIQPRVEIISFNKTTGEPASAMGVPVYGPYGHEYALQNVSFVVDQMVPSGEYPWFVVAIDGGMNIGFNMSEIPVSVDNTQPTASTTPANGATNITTAAGIYAIHFSEPMDNTTGFVVSDLPNVSWNWSNDGRWFNASYNELEGGKRYEFLLGPLGNEFKDLAGNLLLDEDKNKNFTTGKPWATATGPISTGTNNNTPTITYDFGNNATEVDIYTTDDGGTTWKQYGCDDTVDGVWVSPVTGGIGWTGTYQWNVRAHGSIVGVDEPVPSGATSIECGDYVLDMDGPRVNSTIPANWDCNINRAAGTYVIEFDEEMDTSHGTVLSTLPGISWDWDSTGMWLNGTYTVLAAETIYYVNLTGQGFVDLVGNALTGQTDMEFKTERSPWAVAGGQTSEGTDNPRPWISYSATGTTGVEIYYTDDGGTTWTLWGTDDNSNGSWTPSTDLPASGTYNWNARALGYVNEPVPSGAASIESGDYVLLSTADTAYITSTTPTDGATSVGLNAGTYVIQFNRAMNNTGSPLSDLPGVTWSWSSNGIWLNGTYNALSVSTAYYVNLTGQGFQSTSGYPLIGDMYRIFTTRAADETGTGTVVGQVTDENGDPIAGATVTIPGTDITATTNETGWYVLEDVPEGDHTLEISHPDYGTQEVDVSVTEGETETAGTEQLPPPSSGGGDWTWIIIIIVIVVIAAIAGVVLMLRGKKPSGFEEGREEKAEATEPEESASPSKQAPPPED